MSNDRGHTEDSNKDGNLIEGEVNGLSEVEEEAGILTSLREVGEEDHDGETEETSVCASFT